MLMFKMTALMKNYLKIAGISAVVLALVGFPLGMRFGGNAWKPEAIRVDQKSVEMGCDVLSDYTWCEPLQKCLKLDQEKCEGTVPASASAELEASGSGNAKQTP